MAIVKIDIKTDMHGSTAKVEGFDKALGGMRGQATNGTKALKGMWKQMAAGIGVTAGVTVAVRAVVGQVKDMFQVGRRFERQWANVTTMLTITKEATGKMRDELLRLSPTLGDTTELAAGMYQVLSASIEPAKAIKFLGEAAKSAKAGVTETKVAVDALTTVINAYGMEAEDVTEISDIMFGTVKRGKLTYDEMAASLGTIVPVAATVGIEFKEIAAAMATLTRQGINAQTATMQLRQVLMAIISPGKEASKMAKQLELDWSIAAVKAKGLQKFLAEVKEKTEGNVEAMTALVPNVRALTAVMALAGEAASGFADDIKFLNETWGLTEEAFQKQMDSMDFWIETAKVSLDKFKIAFYGGFVTPLKDGITSSDELDATTNQLMDTFKELGTFIGTSFKTVFDSLIRNYETTKRVAFLAQIVTEGLTLAIKNKQIPTLKNVLKLWAEHHTEVKKNKEILEHLAKWSTLSNEKLKQSGETIERTVLPASKEMITSLKGQATLQQKLISQTGLQMTAYQEGLPAAQDMLAILREHGIETEKLGITTEVYTGKIKQMTEAQLEFSEIALGEFLAMQAGLKGFVNAILGTFEQWAIGQAIPRAMALPFPASLIAMGVAIAAIKTAFAGLKGLKEGAVFDKPTFVQAVMGEGGETEILSPESKLKEVFNEALKEKEKSIDKNAFNQGSATITVNQYNSFKELGQHSIRQAGSMLWAEVERQKKRGQLNG